MFNPDTNFSIQAETRFHGKKIYPTRPWVSDRGTRETHIEDFHSAKLHCSVPHYEHAAATELAASTGLNKETMNVTLNDVLQRWMNADSHDVFECHLPQLIPLDYIDRVYMPKNLFASLNSTAQQTANETFKDKLILISHDIDLSLIQTHRTVPLDSTRQSYLKLIIEKINERIEEKIKTPSSSRGFIITVPASKFGEHILLYL